MSRFLWFTVYIGVSWKCYW